MVVGPIDAGRGPGSIQPPRGPRGPSPVDPPNPTVPSDRVEISDQARLLNDLRNLPEIRGERVEELRRAIENRQFETPERLEGAVDEFLDENRDLLA
jgi:hypothetical protein